MAASSAASKYKSFVEVYIWLAKDRDGYTTTSSEGYRQQEEGNLARVGHASLGIFSRNRPSENTPSGYVSLWPGKYVSAVLVDSLERDQSKECEGTLPDVIIRLHKLNIPRMIVAFNRLSERVVRNEIVWKMPVRGGKNVTTPPVNEASCTSCILSLLKEGGFGGSAYPAKNIRASGPNDEGFYNLLKCNTGTRWGDRFNSAPWTGWFLSPKGLLLRVASAAEFHHKDQVSTVKIMHSSRVAKEKVRSEIASAIIERADSEEETKENGQFGKMDSDNGITGLALAALAALATGFALAKKFKFV